MAILYSQKIRSSSLKSISIFLLVLMVSSATYSQAWYNQLKSEHKRSRFGIGIIGSDPLGLGIEVFKGEFCSNGNGYKAKTIWMLNLGIENVLKMPSLSDEVNYDKFGPVEIGGLRGELGLLLPLFSIPTKPVTFQFHVGPSIEGGTRNYYSNTDAETVSTADVAANGRARLTITTSGVEVGNNIIFISFSAGLKYQYVLNAEYSYFRPTFGIIFRKVR